MASDRESDRSRTTNARQSRRNDSRVPPHNLDAEESLLGAMLLSRDAQDEVVPIINVKDFYKPAHQFVFDAIRSLHTSGVGVVDVVTVADELRRAGLLDEIGGAERLLELQNATPAISNALHYAKIVKDTSVMRSLIMYASETAEAAYNEPESVETIVTDARTKLDSIELTGGTRVAVMSGREFADMPPLAYRWVVPRILEVDDRLLVTGGEGAKKSLTIFQWAAMTAAGVQWFIEARCTPQRVAFVDLELGLVRARRRFELFRAAAEEENPDYADYLTIRSKPEDVDIATRAGASWLASIVEQSGCKVLIIGPIYRLTSGLTRPGDIGGEDAAKRAAFALDKIRDRYGCALVAETHAAKGELGRGRDLRPFGSSVWTRWPEFGYGLTRQATDVTGYHPENRDWIAWRGDRDPREWPSYFSWEPGSDWPIKAKWDNSPSYLHNAMMGRW